MVRACGCIGARKVLLSLPASILRAAVCILRLESTAPRRAVRVPALRRARPRSARAAGGKRNPPFGVQAQDLGPLCRGARRQREIPRSQTRRRDDGPRCVTATGRACGPERWCWWRCGCTVSCSSEARPEAWRWSRQGGTCRGPRCDAYWRRWWRCVGALDEPRT